MVLLLLLLLTAATSHAGAQHLLSSEHQDSGDESNAAGEFDPFADWDASVACSNCSCVPYHRCAKIPGEQPDLQTLPVALLEDPVCPSFAEVLCEIPLQEEESLNVRSLANASAAAEEYSTCGHRNVMGIGPRLEGFKDRESQFGEFPWMAIILHDEVLAFDIVMKRFICGGSLIHPQVVMTAAHCVDGKNVSNLSVRLGDWDTQSSAELLPHEEHRVAHVKRHGRFHRVNMRYDVALLFLEEPVELKEHIGTLCLPDEHENFDDAACVATGFGKDRFEDGRFQNVMKQINLPVVSHAGCQSMLRRTARLGRWFRLDPTFTCAGGEAGVDTCVGDGGSALACPSKEDPSKFVQVGIVAWGLGCGEDAVPGVYASVPKLVSWVNQKIAQYFAERHT